MTSCFKVLVHRSDDELHLIMEGDFDHTSADALIRTFQKNYIGERKVFFHTSRLGRVSTSGTEAFINDFKNFPVAPKVLFFTGKSAVAMAPEGSVCL
jgi:hypothetical protein